MKHSAKARLKISYKLFLLSQGYTSNALNFLRTALYVNSYNGDKKNKVINHNYYIFLAAK